MDVIALNGSPSAIQTAVNTVAATGDGKGTVYVPAGTFYFNWTGDIGAVTSPAGVNIIGAGKGVTILRQTNNWAYTEWPSGYFFHVQGEGRAGAATRVGNMSLIGFREVFPEASGRTRGVLMDQVKDFRVDHMAIKDTGGGGVDTMDWDVPEIVCQGVIDHCDIINTNGLPCGPDGIASGPNVLGYGVGVYGSGVAAEWIADTNQVLGKYNYGRGVIYVEDCYFSHWRHNVCSNNNGHYVFRHNLLELDAGFGSVDGHGGGYGREGVGTRAMEIYDNVFRNPNREYLWHTGGGGSVLVNWRGGGGVFFNNRVEDYAEVISLQDEGSNPKYYPRDIWAWGNTFVNGQVLGISNPARNINETINPVYTPYTYPHPLATGAPPSNPRLQINSVPSGIPFVLEKI
jgi:hypothetical protein